MARTASTNRKRSTAQQHWRRVQAAVVLLSEGLSYVDCVRRLIERYRASERQAKRYVSMARATASPGLVVPAPPVPRVAITITVARPLLTKLRVRAKRRDRTVSFIIEEAIRRLFERAPAG
jgi:hypothetical protein